MPVKIAHITDLHLDEEFPLQNGVQTRERLNTVLKDIEKENITEIVCTGDIGENDGIPYFFEQIKKFTLSITLGNHDSFSDVTKHFNKDACYDSLKLHYSAQKDYHKFIYLDSSEGIIDEQQIDWFKKELISNKPIIIFMHHPIIGLNLKVDEIGGLKNRQIILTMLESVPNDITIFCGHYHMESHNTHKNIKQFITPATSFQIEKKSSEIEIDTTAFGYRIIEFNKDKISSKVKILSYAD